MSDQTATYPGQVEPAAVDLELATRRLMAALDALESAVERRREADRDEDELATRIQALGADRSRLADELDGSLMKSRKLERANREIAERLDVAIGSIRSVLNGAAAAVAGAAVAADSVAQDEEQDENESAMPEHALNGAAAEDADEEIEEDAEEEDAEEEDGDDEEEEEGEEEEDEDEDEDEEDEEDDEEEEEEEEDEDEDEEEDEDARK